MRTPLQTAALVALMSLGATTIANAGGASGGAAGGGGGSHSGDGSSGAAASQAPMDNAAGSAATTGNVGGGSVGPAAPVGAADVPNGTAVVPRTGTGAGTQQQ